MVIIEAIGLAATDIFDYNRENFKWDQELRFKKNETRLGMQIERFDLFREDIEDLVNLTVGKMDMYHGVGEIFLAFSLTLYTEGRLLDTSPPFYTSMYFFSVACAWIYILLAVWLAVYASIVAHSFGVRLRTRYVRLPIPSLAQINRLTAQLSDFEKQNAQDMMRVPFSTQDAPAWQYRGGGDPAPASSSSWNAQKRAGPGAQGPGQGAEGDLLGAGVSAFGKDDAIDAAASHLEKHVVLYRRLQAKWQCFDAYSRVSMALGVNNLLQAVNFFVIGITLVNSRSPSCGYVLTGVFQACRLALGYLDIAGMHKRTVTMVQLVGTAPVVIVLLALSERDKEVTWRRGVASAVAFFLMALWVELLIWVAKPSDDEASLPRNYRTVLFLDVYGGDSYDPTEAEHRHVTASDANSSGRGALERQAATTEMALATAQAALRRWEAVPRKLLPEAQRGEVARLRGEYSIWRKAYQGHLVQQKSARDLPANDTLRDQHELRPWAELGAHEREEDEFAHAWVGPLPRGMGGAEYYGLELGRAARELSAQQRVLSLEELAAHVAAATDCVKETLHGAGAGEAAGERQAPAPGAGRHAKAHKVVRLPWKVLHLLSRVMQLMWVFLGVAQAAEVWRGHNVLGRECFPWEAICGGEAPARAEAGRRLRTEPAGATAAPGASGLALAEVPVAWPHGAFFRPTGVFRAPGPWGADSPLVSSPYKLYRTAASEPGRLELEALHGLASSKAVPFCVQSTEAAASLPEQELAIPCLWGALTHDGVTMWYPGHGAGDAGAVTWALQGRPWQLLAGAALNCSDVSGLLTRSVSSQWCLLLAGWDGSSIPLVAVPLSAGPLDPPAPTEDLEPRFDIPVADPQAVPPAASVAALHVEPRAGQLWAALESGALHAWDLRGLRRLGSWRARWPERLGAFSPSAVCGAGGALWVAGVGEQGGPALLRADLPPELVGAAAGVLALGA